VTRSVTQEAIVGEATILPKACSWPPGLSAEGYPIFNQGIRSRQLACHAMDEAVTHRCGNFVGFSTAIPETTPLRDHRKGDIASPAPTECRQTARWVRESKRARDFSRARSATEAIGRL
jgi:hypothetical protein